jgi:ubiquinone/menaquinone biosynthesis C-methylase UbiE
MKISEAVELIQLDEFQGAGAQTWCDLGCGSGMFTLALAEVLPGGSAIYAVDNSKASLRRIPDEHGDISIRKIAADFVTEELPLPKLYGSLMANSLHYVKDQETFLKRLCQVAGVLLIVEYESRKPSVWVPNPMSFSTLASLASKAGYTTVSKKRTRRSRFGGEMYSALAQR